ncbi:MAG: hypothetical protein ACRC9V_12510 [Aeromonas sp.]
MSDKALAWASAVCETQSSFCSSYRLFEKEFKRVFNHPISGQEASKRLFPLLKGSRSAADYAIHFQTIEAGEWMER